MIHRIYRDLGNGTEIGYYIETTRPFSMQDLGKLHWLIAETFEPDRISTVPFITGAVVEIGPRLSIETPFSSNAVSICHAMGLGSITRLERTVRYLLAHGQTEVALLAELMDRMTEQHYPQGIVTFATGIMPEEVKTVDIIGGGIALLEQSNKEMGLGMDARDLEYYLALFTTTLRRNPTNVELFQLGNANSEHSRHWFFKGQMVIDGVVMPHTLLQIVQMPLEALGADNRSLVAFRDNAGVLRGFPASILVPASPGSPSQMIAQERLIHTTATAETHNHPTSVSEEEGAETGVGGRIRDNAAVGRGGAVGMGIGGYFTGNLFIPGYSIPGEAVGRDKPSTYASPLQILIGGSNGVSSYGNKFGEPLTGGFCRTFGQVVSGEWREPRKPVLYSAGIGHIFDEHVVKSAPEVGMTIVRIGGPAYPIGVGGGAASSMMQGQNTEALDYNSVQRGNPEMENRANRVILACMELGADNPISSIHDQGAGGPSNVLTELVEPLGGQIDIRGINLGDTTMSVLTIWSAEFQEGYGLLVRPKSLELFQRLCQRERVNCEVLGKVDGSGRIVLVDSHDGSTPVDLDLKQVLSNMPQKTFETTRAEPVLPPLDLAGVQLREAIMRVFALPAVGSKGFLVHKADRHVGGRVVQQQCCGIAQIPIADVAVLAQSHFGFTGAATAIGEQPVKMLISPQAGARMAVGEMLTNMAAVRISNIGDIRCRANWMWPAKLPHEGARLYDAAVAMADLMTTLGIAVDGGKDSLSMAAKVQGELVKAPGSLVVLGYAPVPDIRVKVTPDIKQPGDSFLVLLDLGRGKDRLGGSALAQAYNQLGDSSPDVDDPAVLANAFLAVQRMIEGGLILAIHDRSDGGLITAVAEMCMATRCGFELAVTEEADALANLFSEELGFILEVSPDNLGPVSEVCRLFGVPMVHAGRTLRTAECIVHARHGSVLFESTITELRGWWEETSAQIEALQMSPVCAAEEKTHHTKALPGIENPPAYRLTFIPRETAQAYLAASRKPKVAVLREEGTNGDREMQAACFAAGLDPWDVTMSDLIAGRITLDEFQGIVFAGGFSYMDVFDSAKGQAGIILFNQMLREMFDRFYARPDTFGLGVCNGCQLMALLGWVPWKGLEGVQQPRFIHNASGRFESRWTQVEIKTSPSILFEGMEGSRIGIWVAHGEGRLVYPDNAIRHQVAGQNLVPLAFVDPFGNETEVYPYNPNGSPDGGAGLCSPDGRWTAVMPHPERVFKLWQWPWMPSEWTSLEASPWLRMFQNARTWCMEHRA